MNHIKMDDIRSDLGIPHIISDIIKEKRLKLVTCYTKTVLTVNHSDTPEDDRQSDDTKLLLVVLEKLVKDWMKWSFLQTNIYEEPLWLYVGNNE